MGYISNGGQDPPVIENNCWSIYYEFDTNNSQQNGSVDIIVPSLSKNYPDFHATVKVINP